MTTALFLGRFQPPHVGHLLTIRSLLTKYQHVIVGVTECEPSVMTPRSVIAILGNLITDVNVSFQLVRGSVEGGTAIIDFPFDVCCSGNPAVLAIMGGKGYQTAFIERSLDSIYSGTRERQVFMERTLRGGIAKSNAPIYEFALVDFKRLRPIEKIHRNHFLGLEQEISQSGIMLKPLIVDKITLAVLDGSHRYAFLLKHGCELAPVLLCDYDDDSVFVGTHLGQRFEYDREKWISKNHVRATAISGKLYEPRTTRHFFPFRKLDMPTEIASLRPSALAGDLGQLISDVSPEQEIIRNNEYIAELQYEVNVLDAYRMEQSTVMNWLLQQNAFIAQKND